MRKIKLFLLFFLIAVQLNAKTYYVSLSGIDGSAGSITSPWRTLHYACSNALTAGDIIHINAGTYVETFTSNLSPGVSIEGEGFTTIISTTTLSDPIILLESSVGTIGNQTISNIKIDGGGIAYSGIKIIGRSDVRINYCMFTNFGVCTELRNTCVYAIYGEYLSDIDINHNTIEGTVNLFFTKNVDVHHNTIGYLDLNIDYKDGIYVCDVDSFVVRDNYFKNLATQIEISSYLSTKLKNISIYNNVMFNMGVASDEWYGSGISFGGLTTDTAKNILIANNTMIANPGNRHTRIGIYLPCVGYATNVWIQNNIFEGFRYATIFAAGPDPIIDVISIENNIFWDNTSDTTQTYCTSDSAYYTNIAKPLNQTEINNLFTDPLLTSSTDFHPTEFSPVIGNGIYIQSIPHDYDNNPRTNIFDIGAYIYTTPTNVIDTKQAKYLIYPVPFHDRLTVVADTQEPIDIQMEIVNIMGGIVQKERLFNPISEVQINTMPTGLYIIRLTNHGKTESIKVVHN